MLPVANRPMMEHIIQLLRRHGFDEIVVTVAFMATTIKTYFGDGSEHGVKIIYAEEPLPLGTAGSVRNAKDHLDERFLVISGDVITDIDLTKIVAFHDEREALATVGLIRVDNPLEFGIVITRDDGTIDRFLEKPTWGQVFSDTINTGIYVLDPVIFDYIAPDRRHRLLERGLPEAAGRGRAPLRGHRPRATGRTSAPSTPTSRRIRTSSTRRCSLDVPGFRISDGVWLGEGAEISPEAQLLGPAVIGPGTKVEAGCRLGEYVVLGSNVRVLANADLERVVLHDNVYVGSGHACAVPSSAAPPTSARTCTPTWAW